MITDYTIIENQEQLDMLIKECLNPKKDIIVHSDDGPFPKLINDDNDTTVYGQVHLNAISIPDILELLENTGFINKGARNLNVKEPDVTIGSRIRTGNAGHHNADLSEPTLAETMGLKNYKQWWECPTMFVTPGSEGTIVAVEPDEFLYPLYGIRLDDGKEIIMDKFQFQPIPDTTPGPTPKAAKPKRKGRK
jgi:hypothetical protein